MPLSPIILSNDEKRPDCCHCGEEIKARNDYIIISRKYHRGAIICFHIDCFHAAAGSEYIELLDLEKKKCLNCEGDVITGKDRVLCKKCLDDIPPCTSCGKNMLIRFNRKNNSAFLGCAGYPVCKSTRKI